MSRRELRPSRKYWAVRKEAPPAPPLVQRPHPPFLVSAQSEESLRRAAQHDIPFAQIDATVDQARRDQALYREGQTAHGHLPVPRLYLMREIYVGNSDARPRRSVALSAAILGIVEPLYAVHSGRKAARQL